MTEKTLLVVGADKISLNAITSFRQSDALSIYVDRSTNIHRISRLLLRRRLALTLLLKMLYCEARRRGGARSGMYSSIRSNVQLVRIIEEEVPMRIVLFRAGLIINKAVLSLGVPVMNIHCARLPEYGGLGSINSALRAGSYQQNATLHRVTESIDAGAILETEPYLLDPASSYCENEARAYAAGARLLRRILKESCFPKLKPDGNGRSRQRSEVSVMAGRRPPSVCHASRATKH